jgi:tRNA(Glu) U13 pseudouridine synthase TruD
MAQMLEMDDIDPYAPSLERGAKAGTTAEEEEDADEEADVDNWFELQGDYRPLLLRPQNMSWEVVRDALQGSRVPEGAHGADAGSPPPREHDAFPCEARTPTRDAGDSARDEPHGIPASCTADVLVRFDLLPGAYATMALREIQKPTPPPTRTMHIRFD